MSGSRGGQNKAETDNLSLGSERPEPWTDGRRSRSSDGNRVGRLVRWYFEIGAWSLPRWTAPAIQSMRLAGIEVFHWNAGMPASPVGRHDHDRRPTGAPAEAVYESPSDRPPRAAGPFHRIESVKTYKSSPRRRRTGSSPFRCCSPARPTSDRSESLAAA
jgi:hypothetical protein